MGKKSPPPRPPDLTPVSNAQLQMAREANELAREQMGLSREQFAYFQTHAAAELDLARSQADRLFGLQQAAFDSGERAQAFAREVGQTQINAMNQQMGFAQKDRERYESVFLPMQDQYIDEANAYDTPERREAEAARQQVDVQRASEAQRANADARLRSMGVDPSQVRSTSLVNQMGVATAANQALSGNMGRQNIEDRGRSMREAAINMGNGLPAQSLAGYGGATNSGNSAVNAGASGQSSQLAGMQAGANLGAMGLGYRQSALQSAAALTGSPTQWAGIAGNTMGTAGNQYNNAGSTLTQGYNNSLNGWQAGQNQSNQLFSNVIGLGSMAAGMFMAEGGAVDVSKAGKKPSSFMDRARKAFAENKIKFKTGTDGQLSASDRYDNAMAAADRWKDIDRSRTPESTPDRIPNILQPMYAAEGAAIRAIPRKQARDKVPAFLAEGEYVLPADVVQAIGLVKLDKMVAKYHRENA